MPKSLTEASPKQTATEELTDEQLDTISGGTVNQPATINSNIMKTKHDTVKNTISNIH